MLRALLVALLLANALFLAWAQGWLSPVFAPPRQGEREPERLAQQVNPALIKVLPPVAASAAQRVAEAKVCLWAGPFSDAELADAEIALARADVPVDAWNREPAAGGLQALRVSVADGELRARLTASAVAFSPCDPAVPPPVPAASRR